jgi:hypothetical protein
VLLFADPKKPEHREQARSYAEAMQRGRGGFWTGAYLPRLSAPFINAAWPGKVQK